ncbi:metal-dependent transcriptional regulator [Leucobacter sp. GX24907]
MKENTAIQYLKVIWHLQEHNRAPVSVTALTRRLTRAPATVSQAIKGLSEAGLIRHERYGPIDLTDEGRKVALVAIRHERIARAFLCSVLGIPWPNIAEEASGISLALTTTLAERMFQKAGSPIVDPYGHPIPDITGHLSKVSDAALKSHSVAVDLRITRVVEGDRELFERFQMLGLTPDSPAQITHIDHATGVIELDTSTGKASLGLTVAGEIYAVTA